MGVGDGEKGRRGRVWEHWAWFSYVGEGRSGRRQKVLVAGDESGKGPIM